MCNYILYTCYTIREPGNYYIALLLIGSVACVCLFCWDSCQACTDLFATQCVRALNIMCVLQENLK